MAVGVRPGVVLMLCSPYNSFKSWCAHLATKVTYKLILACFGYCVPSGPSYSVWYVVHALSPKGSFPKVSLWSFLAVTCVSLHVLGILEKG